MEANRNPCRNRTRSLIFGRTGAVSQKSLSGCLLCLAVCLSGLGHRSVCGSLGACVCGRRSGTGSCVSIRQTTTLVVRLRSRISLSVCYPVRHVSLVYAGVSVIYLSISRGRGRRRRSAQLAGPRCSAGWPCATPSVASRPVWVVGSQSPTGVARRTRCDPTRTSRA